MLIICNNLIMTVMATIMTMLMLMLMLMMMLIMMSVEVGVSAEMGISIDGGEEYREGVLTITEVIGILFGEK